MILVQFSGSVIAQVMVALVMLLTARQLGPTIYGQYVGTLMLATFASIFFSLGLDIWLLREGGRDPNAAGNLAGSVLAIKLAFGSIWLVVMFILAGWIDSQALPASFIRWNAVIVLLDSLFATTLTAFKATLRNAINALVEALSDSIWLIATIVLVILGIDQALPFLQTRFFILLLSVTVAILLVRWLLQATATRTTARLALRNCFPYAASEFLTRLYMRMDVLLVSLMLGEYAVGIYSPAVSITNALFIIPATVHMVMVPVLSNLFEHDVRQGWKTARNNLLVMTVIGIVLSLGVYLGIWLIPVILGEAYNGSQEVLKILSAIPFIHSISFGMASILVATNQQKYRSTVQAISATVNILLNLAVISWAGIQGVAVVYVISDIVLLVGYTWFVVRVYRTPVVIEA